MHAHKDEYTIKKMCEVIGVSRSGYYAYVKRLDRKETEREKQNRIIDERITFHFYDNLESYGSPRIHRKLREVDRLVVSEKKVANRMKEMGLYAIPPKKHIHTTDSNHEKLVYENKLNRDFNPEVPNRVWATDITYIHTGEGFLYLNPILDLCSKRVISYAIDDSMDYRLPLRALKRALAVRNPKEGWIHHSDRGSQYCSNKYIETLKEAGATISMSRKANPYDNACIESFFASLKKEYLHKWVFHTKSQAIAAVQFYIEFYNRKRMHSTLGYATPIEYELAYKMAHKENAIQDQVTSA
nr:IS3 family transposase [Pseudogracilibacillus auburnensis]